MIRRSGSIAGFGLAVVFGVTLSTASLAATDDVASADRMVESFDKIVFHAEFGQSIEPRISKWVGRLNVYLDIRAGDPTLYLRLVEAHIAELADLTGLEIEIVPTVDDANIFMVFDRDEELLRSAADYQPTIGQHAEEIAKTLCFGIYSVNSGFEIKRAVIGIPTDRAASLGKLPACVVEEMTQIMGLPNDSDDISPSIFNDSSEDNELTDLDRWLVRLLYDPAMKPGMDRQTALAQIRSLADDPMIALLQRKPRPGADTAEATNRTSGGDLGQDAGDGVQGGGGNVGVESNSADGGGGDDGNGDRQTRDTGFASSFD
jgi:hypothetical protein